MFYLRYVGHYLSHTTENPTQLLYPKNEPVIFGLYEKRLRQNESHAKND